MTITSLPDDAVTQNGTLLFTDEAAIQCVAVSVSSVSPGSTDESCLTLTLSPTTTVSGLTLSPSVATVCKVPAEGEQVYYVSIIISNLTISHDIVTAMYVLLIIAMKAQF